MPDLKEEEGAILDDSEFFEALDYLASKLDEEEENGKSND